jgi:hypothetical protein
VAFGSGDCMSEIIKKRVRESIRKVLAKELLFFYIMVLGTLGKSPTATRIILKF